MNQIGRRIYFELNSGNVILDTGERAGAVVETSIEQDKQNYAVLGERVEGSYGWLNLPYGANAQDFATCKGYKVDTSTMKLVFSYPDPNQPEPVYQPALTEQVAALQDAVNALLFGGMPSV